MTDSVDLKKLQALGNFIKQNSLSLTVNNKRKFLFTGKLESISADLLSLGLSSQDDVDGIIIDLTGIVGSHKVVFLNWIDQDFGEKDLSTDTVFLNLEGEYVLCQGGLIANHSSSAEFKDKISDVIIYNKLLKTFSTDLVSDHHNIGDKEFVFYSSTKGVIKISYTETTPKREKHIDYVTIGSLIETMLAPNHKIYFINGLFKISNEKPSIDINTIIDNADLLTAIIKRDFEITLKQFDFEKFKDNLLKEKDKYFNSVREIVNKVFGQLIGIPISISATVFATYKVENEPTTLLLISMGFIFYIVLYVKIQLTYRNDLSEIQVDFERDFEGIKLKSGLEASVIEIERIKVIKKITRTKSLIDLMLVGIIILGSSFIIYLLNQFLVVVANASFLKILLRILIFEAD